MALTLSFACWDYDRMKALEDGRVRPEGIQLNFLNYRVEETWASNDLQNKIYRLLTFSSQAKLSWLAADTTSDDVLISRPSFQAPSKKTIRNDLGL